MRCRYSGALALLVALLAQGCFFAFDPDRFDYADEADDAGPGAVDAGHDDAGGHDAGELDDAGEDGGPEDAGSPDAGPGECRVNSDCEDEDPCTEDRCSVGTCSNEPIPSCIVEVAVSGHLCARRLSGDVVCRGRNVFGQIGNGRTDDGTVSVPPFEVSGVAAEEITVGSQFTCARERTRTYCWGHGERGQLGNGMEGVGANRSSPELTLAPGDLVDFQAGFEHICAVRVSGDVMCWGRNTFGELGVGTTDDRYSTPTMVPGLVDVTSVGAGGATSCAVHSDGTVSCWGSNTHGAVGDGTTDLRRSPVSVEVTDALRVATSGRHSCAVRAGGGVLCWGRGDEGQLGDGLAASSLTPVEVQGLSDAVDVGVGHNHTCAIRATGEVVCWGENDDNQLGDDSGVSSPVAVPVRGLSDALDIRVSVWRACARRVAGSVVCWGDGFANLETVAF